MKYVVCLHLYIPWKFGERGSTPRRARRPSLSFFLFVCFFCPSHYDATHRKPRQCVYALNLWGPGISPPDKSPPGQKTPRTVLVFVLVFVIVLIPSGDIFYCSGSRQLNHSSCRLNYRPIRFTKSKNVTSFFHTFSWTTSGYCLLSLRTQPPYSSADILIRKRSPVGHW